MLPEFKSGKINTLAFSFPSLEKGNNSWRKSAFNAVFACISPSTNISGFSLFNLASAVRILLGVVPLADPKLL